MTEPNGTPDDGPEDGDGDESTGTPGDDSGCDGDTDDSDGGRADAPATEAPVRVLHFDPDRTVLDRVGSVLDAQAGTEHTGTADAAAARSAVEDGEFDVIVVEQDADTDVAELVDGVDAPVVLYTGADPTAVDESVLDRADTLVEKWTAEEGLAFVVEKVLGTVRRPATESDLDRAFDRVDPQQVGVRCFLVYEDGTVIWEGGSAPSLFERADIDVRVPETPNFYRKLTALLSHDPEAIRTIRGADVPDEPTCFTVPTVDGEATFRYTEHEFPELVGPVRLVVVEEITWADRAETRLELLEVFDEGISDAISVVDADGRVEYHNRAFADLLGYDDMVGEHTSAFMAEGQLRAGQQAVQRLLSSDADSELLEMEFTTAGGGRRQLAVNFAVRTADGEYDGVVNDARAAGDRVDRERTLDQYRRLVESAGDPMYVVDDDCRIELCNGALAALLGADRESLVGESLATLLPERAVDRLREAIARARETGTATTCELAVPDDDSRFEVTVATLSDGSGSVGILHDVSERERRESELDLLKQVLTRVLRHDVRTGLTVIRGQAEVLAERTSGQQREMVETIIDRSEELVETTEKARAIKRVLESDEQRVTLDLRTVVNRAVANVGAAYPDAEYDARLTEETPVRAHQALPYAVENLIENAVAHDDGAPTVTVTTTDDGDGVELHVVDDGPGISQSELDVLDRGEETQLEHGTGVGLWLVSWVVDRSGGDLSFDTGPDGTTATVRLDRADGE